MSRVEDALLAAAFIGAVMIYAFHNLLDSLASALEGK